MKKLLILFLCAVFALGGCAARGTAQLPEESAQTNPVHIVIASDLHYLAPSLNDKGPLISALSAQSDGKLMLYVEEIAEAFVAQMLAEKPDVVILSGDLSYNGEYDSHKALAEKLARLQDAGIQVLVISGNHDTNNPYSFQFHGESYERVKNTSSEEFRAIYRPFGPARAIRTDAYTGSYLYAARSDLWILMLDTNSLLLNTFPEKSLSWLEECLQQAAEAGAAVISVSHQNLLLHNELFSTGYRLTNAVTLRTLLERYGVLCHLSGHMHIQHTMEGPVPEVLTSSLSMPPVRYGSLYYDGQSLCYDAMQVDVEAWARQTGQTDENLLRFSDYADEYFILAARNKILAELADSGLDEDSVLALADIFGRVNLAYFGGFTQDAEALIRDVERWEGLSESFHSAYLQSILQDKGSDPLHLVLWERPET